jgi:predicted transcriptional regulator
MRKSKLELHINILSVLAENEPLNLTQIISKSNVDCRTLKEQLDFLMKNGLAEVKTLKKGKTVYAITARGTEIIRSFSEIKQVFPLEEVENKQAPFLF